MTEAHWPHYETGLFTPLDTFGREVSVNILRYREQRRNNIGRRNRSVSPVSLIGYFILTLAIIWTAALVPSWGEMTSFEVWFPPSLLTLFFLILAVVILWSGKNRNY